MGSGTEASVNVQVNCKFFSLEFYLLIYIQLYSFYIFEIVEVQVQFLSTQCLMYFILFSKLQSCCHCVVVAVVVVFQCFSLIWHYIRCYLCQGGVKNKMWKFKQYVYFTFSPANVHTVQPIRPASRSPNYTVRLISGTQDRRLSIAIGDLVKRWPTCGGNVEAL